MNAVYSSAAMRTFGERVSKALGWSLYVDMPVGDVETVYIVGLYDPPYYGNTLEHTKRAERRVFHWCGSDVALLTHPELLPDATHLCEWHNLKDELFEKGVDAEVCAFPTTIDVEVTPFPDEPTVGVYLGSHGGKYGQSTVQAVMDAMPGVRFLVYGFGTFRPEDMNEVISNTNVYLRLTRHDGSCNSAREYMEAGRRAVVTADLPFAKRVRHDDLAGIVSALRSALKKPEPDLEAAEYYKAFNSVERYKGEVAQWLPSK